MTVRSKRTRDMVSGPHGRAEYAYSLQGKSIVRIDLDPNLELAWNRQRQSAEVQRAVDQGLPKTKLTGIPFRMEMSRLCPPRR